MAEKALTLGMLWAYAKRRIKELNRNAVIILVSLLVVLFATHYVTHQSSAPSPFDGFARTTENMFRDINAVKLPGSRALIQSKIDCFRAANMIEGSEIFEENRYLMSSYLKKFGEAMVLTGDGLRDMYERGDGLFVKFDIEIRDMIKMLRAGAGTSDTTFLREYIAAKMATLRDSIKEYQTEVSRAKDLAKSAIVEGNVAEKALFDGRREGVAFLANNKHSSSALDLFQKEFGTVEKLLDQFQQISYPLESLYSLLKDYDKRLMEAEALIKGRAAEVDEAGIERLWKANAKLKATHAAFLKKGALE
jgi:hypothetical protein